MATDSDQARAFAERLRAAMHAKGQTSDRNRSGVDVAALARGIGTSYEMARRYVEGAAIPRPDQMQRLADWLEVPLVSLAYGADPSEQTLNPIVLERCLRAVREAQQISGIELDESQAARVVVQLYEEVRRGQTIAPSTLAALIRALGRGDSER